MLETYIYKLISMYVVFHFGVAHRSIRMCTAWQLLVAFN